MPQLARGRRPRPLGRGTTRSEAQGSKRAALGTMTRKTQTRLRPGAWGGGTATGCPEGPRGQQGVGQLHWQREQEALGSQVALRTHKEC